MSVFMMFVRGFILKFTRHGRWADLVVGLGAITLGIYWSSPWTAAFGVIGLISFAVDFNGMVQRRTMAFAQARMTSRKR